MVRGLERLKQELRRVPESVRDEVAAQLEKEAAKLVSEMNALKPIPQIEVAWTWGAAPAGAVSLGSVRGREFGRLAITIYATARESDFGDFPAVARWFEFGTAERFQKSGRHTGRITPSPYFYPVVRTNRQRVRGNITRAVTRALKKRAT